jgi:hypothetical protein
MKLMLTSAIKLISIMILSALKRIAVRKKYYQYLGLNISESRQGIVLHFGCSASELSTSHVRKDLAGYEMLHSDSDLDEFFGWAGAHMGNIR